MCGIVGYIGPSQAIDFLIEGLRRLEYRGYDSSGVATVDDGEFTITKTAGPVDDLAANFELPGNQGPRAYASQMLVDHPELDGPTLQADAALAVDEFYRSLFPGHGARR